MNITRKLALAAGITVTAATTLSFAAPSSAKAGHTNAEWDARCTTVNVSSVKDISNVVYLIDGVEQRIEFTDGTNDLQLPGEISDIWVKAGNNKSGDGPGHGAHYAKPERCNLSASVAVNNM